MRISDWSSDVCSSDLVGLFGIGDREIGAGDDVGPGSGDGGESFAHPFVVADPHGDAVAGLIAALVRAIVDPVVREVAWMNFQPWKVNMKDVRCGTTCVRWGSSRM